MQTQLIHFFHHILQQDSTTLNALNKLNELNALSGDGKTLYFDQTDGILIFTLQGLHQFMAKKNMSYAEFKKCLYGGNLNEELQRLGGKIDIHHSQGKVDRNVYKLVHFQSWCRS